MQINRPMSMKKEIIQTRNRKLTQAKKRKDIEQFSQLISSAAAAAAVADHTSHDVAQWFSSLHQNVPSMSPRNQSFLDASTSIDPCLVTESVSHIEDMKPQPHSADRPYSLNNFYPVRRMMTNSPNLWNEHNHSTPPGNHSQIMGLPSTTTATPTTIPRSVLVSASCPNGNSEGLNDLLSSPATPLTSCTLNTGIEQGNSTTAASLLASQSLLNLPINIRAGDEHAKNSLVPYSTWPVFDPTPPREATHPASYEVSVKNDSASALESTLYTQESTKHTHEANFQRFSDFQFLPLTLP
ncbi:unnamed protein product [Echinostoma caproni]|uniref:BZIP domain-containing protein n=1 Tax=Echinostoma caproni TaxID=27848 RepID=A0A183AHM6_9TREM|nr:unnamed protein product [Echinostoma caproni]